MVATWLEGAQQEASRFLPHTPRVETMMPFNFISSNPLFARTSADHTRTPPGQPSSPAKPTYTPSRPSVSPMTMSRVFPPTRGTNNHAHPHLSSPLDGPRPTPPAARSVGHNNGGECNGHAPFCFVEWLLLS